MSEVPGTANELIYCHCRPGLSFHLFLPKACQSPLLQRMAPPSPGNGPGTP